MTLANSSDIPIERWPIDSAVAFKRKHGCGNHTLSKLMSHVGSPELSADGPFLRTYLIEENGGVNDKLSAYIT
jgi:hypothetical protein